MRLGIHAAFAATVLVCPAHADVCSESHRCITPWTTPTMLSSAWPKLVADGTGQVFFANAMKVAVTSPSGAAIVAGTVLFPCAQSGDVIAFDIAGPLVYWATKRDVCSAAASATMHTTNVLVHLEANANITAIAADGAWVVYAVHVGDGTNEVRARSIQHPRAVVVASTNAIVQHVALAGASAYWVDDLVVRASPLAFSTTFADGPIITAGPTMNIGLASSAITSLRVGAVGAFVSTLRGLEHITLGTSRMVVSGPVDAFALDGPNAYWTSEVRGIVARTSLFTGTTTILTSHMHPTSIAVDAQSVFVVDTSQNMTAIVQIAPK